MFTWWHFLANTLEHTHTETQLFTAHTHTHKHAVHTGMPIMCIHTHTKNLAWQKCAQNWAAPFMHTLTHTVMNGFPVTGYTCTAVSGSIRRN